MSSWQERGTVSLWRYKQPSRGYSGWHLATDAEGAASLVDLLQRFLAGRESASYRTVTVQRPAEAVLRVPNFGRGQAPWVSPSKWRVQVDRLPGNADAWSFPATFDPAVLSLGRNRADQLIRGIEDIGRGKGDYSIGDEHEADSRLWFWWWPGDITA